MRFGEAPRAIRLGSVGARVVLVAGLVLAAGLVAAAPAVATQPVGSNGKVAYNRFLTNQNDLFTINPDGSGAANLTNTASPISESDPAWSPTGTRIAFTRCGMGSVCDILVMNADGSAVTNLTNTALPVQEFAPAFSPDGRLIAFDRSEPGAGSTIWVMNSDGTSPVRLTAPAPMTSSDFSPDFSPDGRTITFTRCFSGVPGQCDLMLMGPDGSAQRKLTDTAPPNSELGASFAPSGASVVFQNDVGNNPDDDLAVINLDGSGRRLLADTASGERRPVYSGDGLRLAFAFTGAGAVQSDIYTSDPNAQSQFNLTNTLGNNEHESNPNWESVQLCRRQRATIVGDDGPDTLKGTKARNVFVANAGKDVVKGRAGNDLICLGKGKDKAIGGKGRDKCIGAKGKDSAKGCEKVKGIEKVGAIAKFK
jgi:Tol biopolymer transport system component